MQNQNLSALVYIPTLITSVFALTLQAVYKVVSGIIMTATSLYLTRSIFTSFHPPVSLL